MDQRLPDPAVAAPPDWRGLCEELLEALDGWQLGGAPPEDDAEQELIDRARLALAQPEPEDYVALLRAELEATAAQRRAEDDARIALTQSEPEGPTDEEIMGLMSKQMHDDLAAAVRAMAEQEGIDSTPAKGVMRIMLNRHVVDLARAVLARFGTQR